MIPARYISSTPDGTVSVWLAEEEPRVLAVVSPQIVQRGQAPGDPATNRAVLAGLGATGRLYSVAGRLHVRPEAGSEWKRCERPETTALFLDSLLTYLVPSVPGLNVPAEWTPTSANGVPERLAERVHVIADVRPLANPPRTLLSLLSADTTQPDCIPTAAGQISHPVVGTPRETWLLPPHEPRPADPEFPHLRAFFSGLDLDPASHVALLTFFLGLFHAASLDADRPCLVVDSWCQERGKSTVCDAVGIVLDGIATQVPFDRAEAKLRDNIVHATKGRRAVLIDNIDAVSDWSSAFVSTLVTGQAGSRRAYGADLSVMSGVAVLMNLVYGAASISRDLAVRANRVELRGEPRRLTPCPREYAYAHREALIAEAILAHADSAPATAHANSRFRLFDAHALGAYARVFGADPAEAAELLRQSRRGAHGLRPEAMAHLHAKHPDAFHVHSDRAFEHRLAAWAAKDLDARWTGARGLGHTLHFPNGEPSWN